MMYRVEGRGAQVRIPKLLWVPVALLLGAALVTLGKLTWEESAMVAAPLSMIALFIPLAAGYTCRITPLGKSTVWQISLTHLAASQLLSFFWAALAKPFVRAVAMIPHWNGLDGRFAADVWIVYVTGCLLYLLSVAFHYVAITQEASREAETRAMQTSMLARDAELKALKAQINPHFIFNSLNSISALTSIEPSRAREMCLLLADFLRITLKLGEKTLIPLAEEIGLLERYLAIEQVRFGPRLNIKMEIEAGVKRCLIPALLLQPLMENAVGHGIAKLAEGGLVKLAAKNHDGRLTILIENSMDPDAPPARRGGVGLRNVQDRLEARYGKEANLRATADEDVFRVALSLPAEFEEQK